MTREFIAQNGDWFEYGYELIETAAMGNVVYVPGLWFARINGAVVSLEEFGERFIAAFPDIDLNALEWAHRPS